MQCAPSFLIKYGNRLTSGLSDHDWERWKPQIEVIQLKTGNILFDAGQSVQHVYFPLSGIISQQYEFADGKSAEFAQMGNEGMAGVWREHTRNAWGNQIWLDLLIAIAIAWSVLLPRARAAGMRTWPWLVLILSTGCIGLAAMFARCRYLESRNI